MAEAFQLYEALLWEPRSGYFLLEDHLRRLEKSASHFRFALDLDTVRSELLARATTLPERPRKIRLELSADGTIAIEDVDPKPSTPVRVALAAWPIDSGDEFLRHKTSRRSVYERALEARPGAEDVLLWNERRELTETCTANLVLEIGGRKLTPPVSSGLLAGTFRCHLLERGEIEEQVLPVGSLQRATHMFLVNSVRRTCELRLLPEDHEPPSETRRSR